MELQEDDGDAESEERSRTEDWLISAATLRAGSSHVQMWMCDGINVAQVKKAGRETAHPHSSLSTHIQIHKIMLH